MDIKIKYFECATKIEQVSIGNWIDVYSNEDVFIPLGECRPIRLGFALELPRGWEGHLAPRSSTFKTWGVIQTNGVGVVDDTYIGDNDEWMMPLYCLKHDTRFIKSEGDSIGTIIKKGDKIGQFRIMESMSKISFIEVDKFNNVDRGGFGTTGSTKGGSPEQIAQIARDVSKIIQPEKERAESQLIWDAVTNV